MGHELVTCWVVANTSSIPGWHVQGAFRHSALIGAESTLMFPEIVLSAAGFLKNSVPHIPRGPSSWQRLLAATAFDLLSDSK